MVPKACSTAQQPKHKACLLGLRASTRIASPLHRDVFVGCADVQTSAVNYACGMPHSGILVVSHMACALDRCLMTPCLDSEHEGLACTHAGCRAAPRRRRSTRASA